MKGSLVKSRILIVDDNEALVRGLSRTLSRHYDVEGTLSAEEALTVLVDQQFDLMLIDLSMPGMNGLELLAKLRSLDRKETAVMMSGSGTIQAAVTAVKLGAADFIEKPVRPHRLLVCLDNALRHGPADDVDLHTSDRKTSKAMIGTSPSIQHVRTLIAKVAPTEGRVLITGENGTGKELIATAIHAQSPRSGAPFIKLNCSAVPSDLIESELFGHERGAFTGASQRRIGRFELADGGTLFLDEVGDMPLAMQAKLLRVLQDGEFERVGGGVTIAVNVRVIAATNRDLPAMVDTGDFREDLYYRLNVFPIHTPTLRDRINDVPLLARHFAAASGDRNRGTPVQLTDGALRALQEQHYPGNIRQLQNIVERLTILIDAHEITEQDVRMSLPQSRPPTASLPPVPTDVLAAGITETDLERQRIVEALQGAGGRKTEAADLLGMSRSTLWRRMRALGLAAKE
jgi:DNA-binding NtrC family response regulator